MKFKIFVSSVQKEFKIERRALKDYILGDALLRRFFEVFLFEDMPASDRRADEVYLEELRSCDIYLGLFGDQYGALDDAGVSATHKEFLLASQAGKPRHIFVKGESDASRHPKMLALIRKAGDQLIRRRFNTTMDLHSAVYASLVQYLMGCGRLLTGPFDAAVCKDATLKDLSVAKIRRFVAIAREARGFPLLAKASVKQVLTHLNLLHKGKPTHAAILLFAHKPQHFLISSEIKCAHFHGVEVQKPIPYYQVYKGTVFELVDQAVDFVLSKINLAVGTREHSNQAPVEYEMPPEVVREAIVNAVAHRDYTGNGSVQVMLFSDRLEVWNPGTLPPSLTLEKLRHPHGSVPGNPLLAEPLYLTKYIERMGTGTGDMITRCRAVGLKEPLFHLTDGFVIVIRRKPDRAFEAVGGKPQLESQLESRLESELELLNDRVLAILIRKTLSKSELAKSLGQKQASGTLHEMIRTLLKKGWIARTIPGKPNSRFQKYRLTKRGSVYLKRGVAAHFHLGKRKK